MRLVTALRIQAAVIGAATTIHWHFFFEQEEKLLKKQHEQEEEQDTRNRSYYYQHGEKEENALSFLVGRNMLLNKRSILPHTKNATSSTSRTYYQFQAGEGA